MFLAKDAPKQSGHGTRGTSKFDGTMMKARNQAENYARAVAKEDGWPPFLMIVDVGHVIELCADFSGQGQGYNQFPDCNRYRIKLEDLREPEMLDLLRTIWTDPTSLDPSLRSAKVTREITTHLAGLGKRFERQGHDSETVARFLMRCLFSMFAEDVDLIPRESFTDLLRKLRGHPEKAALAARAMTACSVATAQINSLAVGGRIRSLATTMTTCFSAKAARIPCLAAAVWTP